MDINTAHQSKRTKCIVPTCGARSHKSNLKFFKFPVDSQRAAVWLKSLGLLNENIQKKHRYVCQQHFDKKYIGVHRLTYNAVPELNLQQAIEGVLDTNATTSCIDIPYSDDSSYNSTANVYIEGAEKMESNIFVSPNKTFSDSTENLNTVNPDVESDIYDSIEIEPTNFEDLIKECETELNNSKNENNDDTVINPPTIIITELECSSTDSISCGNDQNIFATNFTYKNPVFLQMRINKYKEDLEKVKEEQEALSNKHLLQKATNKEILNNMKKSVQLKEMTEFNEIYDKPQMKIPKLIFERFMVDYDNEACPEDLKRFAAEVYLRAPDAYEYMRTCFTGVLPPVSDFQELLKDTGSGDEQSDGN